MDFKAKLQNFWYYYKNYVLVIGVSLLALCVVINSCVTKKNYDLNVLYVTYTNDDSFFHTTALVNMFDKFAPDINGDGKCESQVITINYGTSFKESNSAGAARSANLASGKCLLYLLDERNYKELQNGGFLEQIDTLGNSEYLLKDAYLIRQSGALNNIEGFEKVKGDYYLCLRTFDSQKAKNDKNFAKQYESAKQTLVNIINEH